MLIMGIDFETTGLDKKEDRIIEAGAVLWDTETHTPVKIYNELVKPKNFISVPEVSSRVNGISTKNVEQFGAEPSAVFMQLIGMGLDADHVCAHNGNAFDKPFFLNELERNNIKPCNSITNGWIDTMIDIDYGPTIQTRKLGYVASELGFLNPFPHRAVTDVLTMLKVLSKYDIEHVIARSQSPSLKVVAHVSFAQKDKAKALGYKWDGKRKEWHRNIKLADKQHEEERAKGKFPVTFVEAS